MPDNVTWTPMYEKWRHGGWYVLNVNYPTGAVGCVSNNYPDKKWRIVCDPRPFEEQPTFRTRDEAARAERELVRAARTRYKTRAPGRTPEDEPREAETAWGNGCEIRGCRTMGRIHRTCRDGTVRELCAAHEIEETGNTAEPREVEAEMPKYGAILPCEDP